MRMGGGRFAGANPLRPRSRLENSIPGQTLKFRFGFMLGCRPLMNICASRGKFAQI